MLVGDAVELEHRDAGLEVLGDELERLVDELARARHALDLLCRLADDHAPGLHLSRDSAISWNTASIARSAWMPTTFPRVER